MSHPQNEDKPKKEDNLQIGMSSEMKIKKTSKELDNLTKFTHNPVQVDWLKHSFFYSWT